MALLYRVERVELEDDDASIRRVVDGKYVIAIDMGKEGVEETISEVLLTEKECKQIADLIFNR